MKLSERLTPYQDRIAQLEEKNGALKRDVDRKEFAIKQILMASLNGYVAPKVWQGLRNALLTAEEEER